MFSEADKNTPPPFAIGLLKRLVKDMKKYFKNEQEFGCGR